MTIGRLVVIVKRFISRVVCVASFCKVCGRKVRDFHVDDESWAIVHDALGVNVLCFDCFCAAFDCAVGGVTIWKLVNPGNGYWDWLMGELGPAGRDEIVAQLNEKQRVAG